MQRTRPICQRYFRRAAYIRALRRASAGMVTAEKAQSRRFKYKVTRTEDTTECYTDGSARGCTLFLSVTSGGLASAQDEGLQEDIPICLFRQADCTSSLQQYQLCHLI
ncbi:uncharacterized protein LOC119180428 isoform X4 [Rhipicephalus microplus]|uniref:uncharacterized protein LOC119180428 isoform X4 n=1 Tax=Rhipicephalus microplus TaxID=6941 RepID=UPI003F6AD8AA